MSNQTLSLQLPGSLYSRLEARARKANHSVEAETVAVIAGAVADTSDPEVVAASLAVLDDQALLQAAHNRMAPDAFDRIEELHRKRQREGLTDAENNNLADLMRQYERAMTIRSQAIGLLHRRGHDVSNLLAS